MKPKLGKIKHYINEEVKPYFPMVISNLHITDISPKKISKSNPVTEPLLKPVKINRHQSINKKQIVFYKPAYRIKATKLIKNQ